MWFMFMGLLVISLKQIQYHCQAINTLIMLIYINVCPYSTIWMNVHLSGSQHGPGSRYQYWTRPPKTTPAGGRALSPQPAISLCTLQTGCRRHRPSPAGILQKQWRLLRQVISPHIFIPLSLLLTSLASRTLSPSTSLWRRHHLS